MILTRRPNSLRYPDADYSDPGMYFVTMCTQGREPLFGEITEGKFKGNDLSRIAWAVWRSIPERYSNISIDAAIVMPEHFHGIIVVHEYQTVLPIVGAVHPSVVGAVHEPPLREPQHPHPQPRRIMTIPLVVGYLKMNSAKQINEIRNKPGERVWQRGYYDRIVRIDREYDATVEYILTNPERWGLDKD